MERPVEDVEVFDGHEQPYARALPRDVRELGFALIHHPVSTLNLLDSLVEPPLGLFLRFFVARSHGAVR